MIKLLLILCVFSQIKEINPNKTWEIEIVTKKTEKYYLLTKNEPISIGVEGPTYLKVYTRIPWFGDIKGRQIYKIILQENDMDERIITLESEKSNVTKNKKGRPLSKWRSFYIEVPEGMNKYKIINWSSPNDTILLKFKYESPKKWADIPASDYNTIIESIEEEKIVKYYELKKNEQLTLGINGPARLKVISRLNYDEKIMGDQNYTILADDNGNVKKFTLKCYKSQTIEYKDRKEIVPSNARNSYINIPKGWHNIKFSLSGTIAKSVSLRFQVEKK
ncbi:MAG: hypothetical protein E3J47_04425 [Candidatus Stahlbacteria bacterium]|nr:MAG: hypothetical protein E3J47_04425 [Candidatus Stahlbacteria bacterium]